uniref:Killer cell lectin-like receptor subfamily B member 1A n=1 Tax=Cynoglossus semilaevis TaxID=244447 RepID=A0A3P8UG52_CYNSE
MSSEENNGHRNTVGQIRLSLRGAKAKDLQIPEVHSVLMVELNYYRNHSNYIGAKQKAQEALVNQRTDHLQLKLQLKQKKTFIDGLLGQIESLQVEKSNLKYKHAHLDENCGRCSKDWILFNSSCYYISHRVNDHKKNWPDSRADCIRRGSDLLIIDYQDEQMLLNENLERFVTTGTVPLTQIGFWIGLSYKERQETWTWVNNVTEVKNLNWKNRHAALNDNHNGSCAAYYFGANLELWRPVSCQNQQLNWICEQEPKRLFSVDT